MYIYLYIYIHIFIYIFAFKNFLLARRSAKLTFTNTVTNTGFLATLEEIPGAYYTERRNRGSAHVGRGTPTCVRKEIRKGARKGVRKGVCKNVLRLTK